MVLRLMLVDLAEQGLAAVGGGFEQRVGGDQFVVHDVAEGPACRRARGADIRCAA